MKRRSRILCAILTGTLLLSTTALTAFADVEEVYELEKEKILYQDREVLPAATQPELLAKINGINKFNENSLIFPSSYSSLDLGYVSSVKDQGNLGVCWAFSAIGALESYLLKNGKGEYDFSEEHLNHWATQRDDNTGWLRNYSSSGFQSIPLGYLTSWSGPRLESEIPYRSADNKTFDELNIGQTSLGVTQAKYVENNQADIKQTIIASGAISTCYSALSSFQSADKSSVYCPETLAAGSNLEGHSIVVIGWDDNYDKNKFKQSPENNGAWLVKNSWGNYNNLNGYFWISYEDAYIFNSTVFGNSYAITDSIDINDKMKLYQNEEYGATYNLGFTLSYSDGTKKPANNITYINLFDFTEKYDTAQSIVFESTSINSNYKLYFIPVEDNKPVNNQASWTLLSTGTIAHKGYNEISLEDFELPYSKGAFGITIDATNSSEKCSLGCDEWLYNPSSGSYRFLPSITKNGSYLVFNNNLYSLAEFYSEFFSDDIGSNFVIKAITTTENEYALRGDINADGEIDLSDVLLACQYSAFLFDFNTRSQYYSADINSDGDIDIIDALCIQKVSAKLISADFFN